MQIWDDCRLWTALRWVVVAGFDGNLFALKQVRLVLGGVIVPRRPSPNVLIGKPAPSLRLRYRQACLSTVASVGNLTYIALQDSVGKAITLSLDDIQMTRHLADRREV